MHIKLYVTSSIKIQWMHRSNSPWSAKAIFGHVMLSLSGCFQNNVNYICIELVCLNQSSNYLYLIFKSGDFWIILIHYKLSSIIPNLEISKFTLKDNNSIWFTFVAWELIDICKFSLLEAGSKKLRAVLDRNPSPVNVWSLQNP